MSKKKIPLLSICIPVLNEEDNLLALMMRLDKLRKRMQTECNFEYIFTDNDSSDSTWEIIKSLKIKYPQIRAFRFNKNIGFQNSILFNYKQAKGDAVVQLDADLQDPPELIETFFNQWKSGIKVVTGIRVKRQENYFINQLRKIGYRVIDLLSETPIKPNAGDFRLLDRQIIDVLSDLKINNPYLRGIISNLNLPEMDIEYDREARKKGKSKFGILNLMKLGLNAIANHSSIPIRIANYVGGISLFASAVGLIYYVTIKFTQPNLPRGFASLYVLILFGIGVNSIILGVIGSYIRKIFMLLTGENKLIVRDSI